MDTTTASATPLPPIPVSSAMLARRKAKEECKRRAADCCAVIRAYFVANLNPDTKQLRLCTTDDFWCEGIENSNEFKALCDEFRTKGGWNMIVKYNVTLVSINRDNNVHAKHIIYVTPL
jgi:hypothetical protein